MEYLYKQYNNEPGKAPTGEKYIYVITEIETGKMYIGQTSNFHARMRSHRTCKCNQHSAIDRAIQEKGADAFQYEILELCAADDADSRERYRIEKSDSCNEQKNQDVTIRLPYGLGCGLAGGDWNTVLAIINDAAKAWNLNVEIWKLQK